MAETAELKHGRTDSVAETAMVELEVWTKRPARVSVWC